MASEDLGKEELRIALVMNGGVSLAVWIGGVVREVARLLSGRSAYGELAALLEIDPRVDVIAGTSAGGVNGAYLAMAMAYNEPGPDLDEAIGGLRNLWVDQGSIDALLRSPLEVAPPSLLDGDNVYFETLLTAFNRLKRSTASDVAKVPIDLTLSATLLKGAANQIVDDYGNPVSDVDHRARFRFRRGEGIGDQLAAANSPGQLAVAARTTSSFPGAFEPSFCPVGTGQGWNGRPDMAGVADFNESRFLIDGGILDNKPLDLALESIFQQPTTRPARRVLAYVVPAPEATVAVAGAPESRSDSPGLLKVVLSSLVEIPSVQSISAQIDALRKHNDAVRAKRRSRIVITRHNEPMEIDGLSATLFAAYRDMRVIEALDYVIEQINEGLIATEGTAPFGRRGRREWLYQTLCALKDDLPWVPAVAPLAAGADAQRTPQGWRWGARPVEHSARFLLDLMVRTQRLAAARRDPLDLSDLWRDTFDRTRRSRGLRSSDRTFWQDQAKNVAKSLGTGLTTATPAAGAKKWFKEAVINWTGSTLVKSGELAMEIAGTVKALAPVAMAIATDARRSPDESLARDAEDLLKLVGYFVRDEGDGEELVLARLLAFEVVQEALGAHGTDLEEEVDFIQISGDDDAEDGRGLTAAAKLSGVQLAHFGAFYKRSWRANDWLWGRRDAVRRLVRLTVDPSRLRTIALRHSPPLNSTRMAQRIRDIAVGFGNAADTSAAQTLRVDLKKLTAELAYLDDTAKPVPERLPQIVEALARRLELEILCEELPLLAGAVEMDQKANLATSIAVAAFASDCSSAVKAAGFLSAATARTLESRCNLGGERLQQEAGTDPATRTIAQTLAVSVAALRSDKAMFAALGSAIGFLRAPTLLFYAFARNLAKRSRTGLVINVAVAAAAAVIVSTAALAEPNPYGPSWIVALASAALIAAGFLLVTRLAAWLRWILAVLLLVGTFAAVEYGFPRVGLGTWKTIALVEAALLAFPLLGRLFGVGKRVPAAVKSALRRRPRP